MFKIKDQTTSFRRMKMPCPNHFNFLTNLPTVGMVKQPTAEQTEFTMSSEDFPALPGTQNAESGQLAASQGLQGVHHHHHSDHHGADSLSKTGGPIGGAVGMGMDLQNDAGNSNVNMDKGAMKRGVQTSPNGTPLVHSIYSNHFSDIDSLFSFPF